MSVRALVTGGAGFVGSHLAERLLAHGCEVAIIDDFSRGLREWVPSACTIYETDIRDQRAVRAAVEEARCDVVLHLAALHYIPAVDGAPDEAWDINVHGTTSVLSALEATPPATLVFASTAAVYPDSAADLAETTAPAPIDLYGRTKVAGEELARAFAASTSTRCVLARLFNVIGPRETNPHVVVEIVEQLRAGAPKLALGNMEPQRDFTDVRDVADALALLALQAPRGVSAFNIGSGRGVSVGDLVRACERILRRAIPVRVAPERLRPVERLRLVADTAAIRSVVDWLPRRRLEDTLAELLGAP